MGLDTHAGKGKGGMGVCGDSWAGGRYISTGDVWKRTPRLVAIEAGGVVVAGVGLAWDACSSFECRSKSKPLDTWQERRTPVRVGAGCQGARGTHVHVGVGSMHVMVMVIACGWQHVCAWGVAFEGFHVHAEIGAWVRAESGVACEEA